MPHQCVRCNSFYADDAAEILEGCNKCEGKLFFYVKQAKVAQARDTVAALSDEAKLELEEQVADIVGHDADEEQAVVVDLESIRSPSPGKYEIDLKSLLDPDKPVVYKMGEGKYVVDIVTTFQKLAAKREKQQ